MRHDKDTGTGVARLAKATPIRTEEYFLGPIFPV